MRSMVEGAWGQVHGRRAGIATGSPSVSPGGCHLPRRGRIKVVPRTSEHTHLRPSLNLPISTP